jgi:hypothetical protein
MVLISSGHRFGPAFRRDRTKWGRVLPLLPSCPASASSSRDCCVFGLWPRRSPLVHSLAQAHEVQNHECSVGEHGRRQNHHGQPGCALTLRSFGLRGWHDAVVHDAVVLEWWLLFVCQEQGVHTVRSFSPQVEDFPRVDGTG